MNVIFKGFYNVFKKRKHIYYLSFILVVIYIYLNFLWKMVFSKLELLGEAETLLEKLDYMYVILALRKSQSFEVIMVFTMLTFILYFFLSQYIVKNFIEDLFNKKRNLNNYKKILLLWIPFVIVGVLIVLFIGFLLKKEREFFTVNPNISIAIYYLRAVLMFLFYSFLTFFDFSRLIAVRDDKSVISSLSMAVNFVVKNFYKILLIVLFFGFLTAALSFLWLKLYALLNEISFSYTLTFMLNLITIFTFVSLKFYMLSVEKELLR